MFAAKRGGCTQELCVKLSLHNKISVSGGKKTTPQPQCSSTTPQKPYKRNPSSPQLSGVWASRSGMRPLNWSQGTDSTVTAERKRSKEPPVSFLVGRSPSSTPTDSVTSESEYGVLLRHPRPVNRTSSAQNPSQRPFHHSVSGPLQTQNSSSSNLQSKTRPRSDNYGSVYSSASGSSLAQSSQSSRESLNGSLSSSGSWSKVVNRKQRTGSGSGQYIRSQSSTQAQQKSSGRGRRGKDGGWRGGANSGPRKPFSEPSHRHS